MLPGKGDGIHGRAGNSRGTQQVRHHAVDGGQDFFAWHGVQHGVFPACNQATSSFPLAA